MHREDLGMFLYHFKGSNLLPRILSPVVLRTQGYITLALWPFGDQYCTDIQSILLLSRLLIPFLLRWSVWRNMRRRFPLHCRRDKWAVRGWYEGVAGFSFSPRHHRSPWLRPLTFPDPGPTPLQHRSRDKNRVSGIRCGPCTSHMPTRVQFAHTNM